MKIIQILSYALAFIIQVQSQSCPDKQCTDPGQKTCKDPKYYQCIDTKSDCQNYSTKTYNGRRTDNYQCLEVNSTQSDTQVQCWNSTSQQICITNTQNQCIDFQYEMDPKSNYVGLLNNTQRAQSLYKCAQPNTEVQQEGELIKLKPPYCLDLSSKKIVSLDQGGFVGIDSKTFNCLQKNQTSNNTISFCSKGYCIFNNTCTPLSQYLPAKLINFACAQIETAPSIECFSDLTLQKKYLCLDLVSNVCTNIVDLSRYAVGIQPNGTCVQSNVTYSEISFCSDQSCIYKNGTQLSCIPFNDTYIGIDKQQLCLQRGNSTAVRCKKYKFCIEQKNFTCVDLSTDYPFDRIARETNTTNCLKLDNINGQNIEMCANGYCLYSETKQLKSDFCIPYGGSFKTFGPFIGVESVTERCLLEKDEVDSILLCFSLNYCILNNNNGKQICQKLFYPFSYDKIDETKYNYAAKNSTGYCQYINQANSVSCAGPQLCLQGDKCISLNDNANQNSKYVGREASSQTCIGSKAYFAMYCKLNYCLINNKCFELDSRYVGREYESSKCLFDSQKTNKQIIQCIHGYCIQQPTPQQYSCVQLDYDPAKKSVGQNSLSQCLDVGQTVAVSCFKGQTCLYANACQIVDPLSNYKCSASDGTCLSSINNCSLCNYQQCLKPNDYKTCVFLDTNCQDTQGRCADTNSGQCSVCPQKTCLVNGKCIAFKDMKMKENECLKQIRPDRPCVFIDMNVFGDDNEQQCANFENVCVLQSQANPQFQCLRCPKNLLNLGDNRCLSFQQRDDSQKQNMNTIFQLNLIYVNEDTCKGVICSEQLIKKCPPGCYSCKDLNYCTQCIEGYFLFKKSEQSVQCIQCDYNYIPINQYPDTYRLPFGTNQITQKCLDCSLETGSWNNAQMSTKLCQQTIVKFTVQSQQSLILIENQPPFAMSYTVNYNSNLDKYQYPKYYLTFLKLCVQDNCTFCQLQWKDNQQTSVCTKCLQGYYLDQSGQCQACIQGCTQCELGFLNSNGVKQYYYQISQQQRQYLGSVSLTPICQICNSAYIFSYDLTKCDPCGKGCASCQYANENGYFNIGESNNVQLTDDQYKSFGIFKQCSSCILNTETQQVNGSDCGEQIQNCAVHSLINSKTNQINQIYDLSYFKGGSSTDSSLICLACQFQYILSSNKKVCQTNYNIIDVNCLQFETDNVSCKLCKQFALDKKNKVCDTNYQCSQAVAGCDKCVYEYYQDQQLGQLMYFTCLECSKENYMITLLGCVQCFEGCSRCYEMGYDSQKQKFNITAHIMYEKFQYDIDTRLNYKRILNAKTFCSACLDGYYFDPIQKICIAFPCGQLCNTCIFQINRFYCLDCNQTAVIQQISSIQLFMGNFFFGQNYFSSQLQISTFTSDQKSCQSCPFLCETCDQTNNLFQNDYSIYQTKCFSCKTMQQLQLGGLAFQSYFQGYEVRFDKQRSQCTLCKIEDQSCYFKKYTKFYIKCEKISLFVGEGTKQSPFNLNMISEINNFDNLILDEMNSNLAFVALNEISLKQLDVDLVFPSGIQNCILLKPLEIKSNLMQKIKSLEVFHLNITYESESLPFHQILPTKIQGFTNVSISNLTIDSYSPDFDQFKIGFQITSPKLKQVYFNNIKFQRGYKAPQNVLLIQLSNLLNTLIIRNTTFSNIFYNNYQAIKIDYPQGFSNPDISIILDNVNISNVTFNSSSFIQVNQNNTQLSIINSQVQFCEFDHSSNLFEYLTNNYQFIQMVTINNFILNNNLFQKQSKVLSCNQFIGSIFSNILITNNTMMFQDQNQVISLFELNCLQAKSLFVQNNKFTQYVIFKALRKNKNASNQFHITNTIFNDNTITSSQYIFLIDSNQFIDQFIIQSITINKNQIIAVDSQSFKICQFITLSNINKLILQDAYLANYGEVQLLKVISANYLKLKSLKGVQSEDNMNNYSIIEINNLLQQMILKKISLQNIVYQKAIIEIYIKQKQHDTISEKVLVMQDIQIINCTAYITQQQFNIAPIFIGSQIKETLSINNFIVQGSKLLYAIKANETPTKISTCAYIEAQIGNIEVLDSKFLNNFSIKKSNCLMLFTKQLKISNSIFKNDDFKLDSSNTTVKGGFIYSLTERVDIMNSHFEGGIASQGGALYLVFQVQGFLNVQGSSFLNNLSFNQFDNENKGGAIYIDSQLCGFQGEIQSSSFIQNIAYYQGGAIFIQNSQSKKVIKISQSEFINNYSKLGSVFYFEFQKKHANVLQLIDSSISYNPKNFQQNLLQRNILKYFQEQSFNFQQFFINGFVQVNLFNNKFIMDEQPYSFMLRTNYDIQAFIQAQEIERFIDQNNSYQNIAYQTSLIKLLQIVYTEIISSQFYKIASQTAGNFIQIESNYIHIFDTQFYKNHCQSCNNGLLQISSYYLSIMKSNFEQNQVKDKGVLFIHQNIIPIQNYGSRILSFISDLNYLFELSYLTFKSNQSQKSAGAVYIESSSTYFLNCSFVQNIASEGNGGAIYYKGVEQKTNIKIKNSLFYNNLAQIGGAIYSENGQAIQNIQSQNTFISNIAKRFSSNTFQYPHHMIAILNGTTLMNKTIIHSSGKINNELSIQLMTQENEFFMEFQQNITLNIVMNDTKRAYLNQSQIIQQSGNFKLNNVILYGVFGITVKLTFSSSLIKYPLYDTFTGEITSYSSEFNSFDLIVKFVEGCELGYQHVKIQRFDSCQRCSDPFYNTYPGQKCIKCPNYGICDGSMMYLREGYWRQSLNSSQVYECNPTAQTCQGDIDIYQKKTKQIRNQQIRYCKKGFTGYICSDCDLYGKFWNSSFVQDGNLGCIDCSQTQSTIWVYILIVLAYSILTLYMVNSYLSQIASNVSIKVLYLMKVYIPRNTQQTSFYIKLITSYLQIFMIVSDIIKAQLQKYQVFISPLSDPNKKALFSLDCSLIDFYKSQELDYIFVKVLLSQLTIIAYIIIFILFYFIQRLLTKQKIYLIDIFSGINFIYIANQPSVVQQVIGSASCVGKQGIVFVRTFTSISCDEKFYEQRNKILFPILILWTVFIPLFLLYCLRKIKYHLNKVINLKLFGVFYFDFKEKYYFWELIKISLKSIIVIVNNTFVDDQNPLKASIVCAILLVYSISINQYKPNINKILNYMEQLVYILCSISIGLCAYLSESQTVQQQSSSNIAFYILIIINVYSVCILIKNIIQIILKEQIINLGRLIDKKIQNLPKLKYYLKRLGYFDRNRILYLWKVLRKSIQSINLYQASIYHNNIERQNINFYYQKSKNYYINFSSAKTAKTVAV
ncbi:transmembrane protein, putative (macronuclear) [Tetrahymena thermophila SB210]|uniref:Transmembrane protein, putative n=1 Tax=Tetrahymena thermophila (strain SB210) TaxID=312017 RepID=Q23J68_TETTS|nr:transmembrane protein, putative [Tetrahymena thermophila SB210]EAR96636.2 transmembrane protein, putative [Tetrahymena thermophila SB210]|eukprot:XP_001016881.2 transmembrane protein, putative [Tetrahymena thermophila SB210]